LKYLHAHHAGNFADVHKHVTLLASLTALQRKAAGFLYAETHAGAGLYDLGSAAARLGSESSQGIERVMASAQTGGLQEAPSALATYIESVRTARAAPGRRHAYPGSPLLACKQLRAVDRAALFEIDAALGAELRHVWHGPARCQITHADGYQALRSVLPPRERRALVLIDPPYEDAAQDRRQILEGLADALRRFATGVYLVWYPLKLAASNESWLSELGKMLAAVKPLPRPWLASEFWIHPVDSRASLNGSGMAVINPPFRLGEELNACNAALLPLLGHNGAGHQVLNFGS
jgi:23S rRNA (adenine2030-N6)-methyltransferase